MPSESCDWLWQITPSFSVAGSGSADMGSGGIVYSPAATSLLRWQITPRFSLEMANQIGYFTGEKLDFDQYSLDPGVQQTILKNGLEAQLEFGNSGWYCYGGASYTNFLEDAAISNYITPEVGVGWRTGVQGTTVELGFTGQLRRQLQLLRRARHCELRVLSIEQLCMRESCEQSPGQHGDRVACA